MTERALVNLDLDFAKNDQACFNLNVPKTSTARHDEM